MSESEIISPSDFVPSLDLESSEQAVKTAMPERRSIIAKNLINFMIYLKLKAKIICQKIRF